MSKTFRKKNYEVIFRKKNSKPEVMVLLRYIENIKKYCNRVCEKGKKDFLEI